MKRSFPLLITTGLLSGLAMGACSSATRPAAGPGVEPSTGDQPSPATTVQMRADSSRQRYTAADVQFMTGMIRHHAQAVLMAGWAPSHDADQAVRILCERILVGQQDEIAFMQRWLRDRNQPAPDGDPSHDMMPGMDHSMLMPGMLTAEQLAQLDSARGPEFDRLFLTSMIQHHQGALTMVHQLFNSPGAAQDDNVFKFTSDMNADQTTEIDRMTTMLGALASGTQ